MKTKVYVNWERQEILSESEFNEMLADKVQEKINDENELSYYLENENPYTYSEIFWLTPTEREMLFQHFKDYCKEEAESEVMEDDDWFERFIEI